MTPPIRRTVAAVLSLVSILVCALVLEPTQSSPVQAIVPPPGLAAALLQALPTLASVTSKLFPTNNKGQKTSTPQQDTEIQTLQTQSNQGIASVKEYAAREQEICKLVDATSGAMTHIEAMRDTVEFQTTLTKSDIRKLKRHKTSVDAAIDTIVKTNPPTTLFKADSQESTAIHFLVTDGPTLKTNIATGLGYDPSKPDLDVLHDLQKDVIQLDEAFRKLNDSTKTELQMIADELSAVAVAPASAPKPAAVKAAGKKVAKEVFGDQNFTILEQFAARSRKTWEGPAVAKTTNSPKS